MGDARPEVEDRRKAGRFRARVQRVRDQHDRREHDEVLHGIRVRALEPLGPRRQASGLVGIADLALVGSSTGSVRACIQAKARPDLIHLGGSHNVAVTSQPLGDS